jgi:hypothetical protein
VVYTFVRHYINELSINQKLNLALSKGKNHPVIHLTTSKNILNFICMKTKRIIIGLLLLLVLFFVTSCAPVGMTKEEYGFLYGIVHGFISPFLLIAKLLGANVGLYAEHNSGSLYWLGFIFGLVLLLGGGGGSYATRRRWYD